jgi:hypothetical protein
MDTLRPDSAECMPLYLINIYTNIHRPGQSLVFLSCVSVQMYASLCSSAGDGSSVVEEGSTIIFTKPATFIVACLYLDCNEMGCK